MTDDTRPWTYQEAADLSPREREVLLLCADGLSASEAAKRMGISPWTVKRHRDNARRKLGAASLPQAVAMVMRRAE